MQAPQAAARLEVIEHDITDLQLRIGGFNTDQQNLVALQHALPQAQLGDRYEQTQGKIDLARDRLLRRLDDKVGMIQKLSLASLQAGQRASIELAKIGVSIRREIELPLDEERCLARMRRSGELLQRVTAETYSEIEGIVEQSEEDA